jgi:molybdopterin-guanine dinucleotide biosynthesis protein A
MVAPLAAVILAGGRATRMGGGDKCLLDVRGRPLLVHLIDRLTPQVTQLALNANGDPGRFAAFGLPILPDPMPGQPGPLAGVLAGMDWAAGLGFEAVLTVAGDTPFPPPDLAVRLMAAGPFALAASVDETGAPRLHPTVGLWPVALRLPLRAALNGGERRVGHWALAQGAVSVLFEGHPDPFLNLNTPQDLSRA